MSMKISATHELKLLLHSFLTGTYTYVQKVQHCNESFKTEGREGKLMQLQAQGKRLAKFKRTNHFKTTTSLTDVAGFFFLMVKKTYRSTMVLRTSLTAIGNTSNDDIKKPD